MSVKNNSLKPSTLFFHMFCSCIDRSGWLTLDDFDDFDSLSDGGYSSSDNSDGGYSSYNSDEYSSSDSLALGDACVQVVVTGHKDLVCTCIASGDDGPLTDEYDSFSVVVSWFDTSNITFTAQISDSDSDKGTLVALISDLPKKVKAEVRTLVFDAVRQWSKGECHCTPTYTFCPTVTLYHEYVKV